MVRRHVVIRTPWGDLVGDLDAAATADKIVAFSMAAGMLGKGSVAEWYEVAEAQPGGGRTCELCGHPDFAHQSADPAAGEPDRPCVSPGCSCAGLLLLDEP